MIDRPTDADEPPLRVGVVLSAAQPPRWQARALRGLSGSGFVDLSVYVVEAPPSSRRGMATAGKRRGVAGALFGLYERIDRSVFGSAEDALAATEMPAAEGPELVGPGLASLRNASLDVIILLDRSDLEEALRGVAPQGVWTLRFGGASNHGAPHLFWELYESVAVSEVTLVALGEAPASERVIYRSCLPADPVSLHRARLRAYGTAGHFPMRCLSELRRGGLAGLEARARWLAGPVETGTVGGGPPSVSTLARHLVRVSARAIRRVLRARFVREDWRLGVRPHRGTPAVSLEGLRVVSASRRRFLADPFVFENTGRHWLFFEDYSYADRKGLVSVAQIGAGGVPEGQRQALAGEQHFAYPCVFRWGDDVFMVPDRSKARRVELYRAIAFPDRWRLEKVLMEGVTVVDPTVFPDDDRLWMFAAVDDEGVGPLKSDLSLFSAESPSGPWIPHPGNPVVTDVRRARPAGMVFRRGAELIRPGQDNSRRYGGAVTLSRIEVLDADEYREVPVGRIGPEQLPRACGLHTYNADSAYETIDFCRALPRLPLPGR